MGTIDEIVAGYVSLRAAAHPADRHRGPDCGGPGLACAALSTVRHSGAITAPGANDTHLR